MTMMEEQSMDMEISVSPEAKDAVQLILNELSAHSPELEPPSRDLATVATIISIAAGGATFTVHTLTLIEKLRAMGARGAITLKKEDGTSIELLAADQEQVREFLK
jgi:hypothetical protein